MIAISRPARQRTMPIGMVILIFCFLLLLSQGFVTSGDDWFFTSRTMDESFVEALQKGWANATGHYRGTNGRLLGNGFSKVFGCSEFWREIARCGILLVILLQLCRMAKVGTLPMYALALMLLVAIPVDLYAQAYAWAAGFFNYVPPLVVILAYILRTDRLLSEEQDSLRSGLGMFLLTMAGQLFVENATIGMCLLTGSVLLWYVITHKKMRFTLLSSFLGSVLGCIIMFAAPGYSNVNQEGYRQVSDNLEALMKVIKSNFSVITQYLTENNWMVIVPVTALCLWLLLGSRPEKRWQQAARKAAVLGLMICPVYFYAHYNVLGTLSYAEWVAELSFWLDAAANLMYLISVLTAVLLGMQDENRRNRAVLCIAAVPAIFGPLVVVYPVGPRCLYIPYMLLVCLLLILAQEAVDRVSEKTMETLKLPVIITVACVLTVYLWTAVWNGHCEQVRTERIEAAMAAGASSVELPSFPYGRFLHNGNGGVMKYYYYYETPGDLELVFIDHDDWYRN